MIDSLMDLALRNRLLLVVAMLALGLLNILSGRLLANI